MRQLDRGGIKLVFRTAYRPLFFTVCEIYGRKVSKWWKIRFFSNFLGHPVETPWPILTVLHQNVRSSVPYILDHIWKRWAKIKMVAIHCTNETTPHFWFFWVFNSPSTRPQAPMDPEGEVARRHTFVPTQIKFGVDPSTRCWDIAQKHQNAKIPHWLL